MVRRKRRALGVAVSIFTVMTAAAWTPEPLTESGILRLEASGWAKSTATKLPTDFNEFSRLSIPKRRAALQALPWEARERLWHHHVETFLLPPDQLNAMQRKMLAALDEPLTQRQKAFLGVWRDSLLTRAYEPGLTNEGREVIVAPYCERAKTVLGKAKASLILGQIGPVDSTYSLLLRSESRAAHAKRASLLDFDGGVAIIRRGLSKVGLVRFAECWCHVSSLCDCQIDGYCVNSNCQLSWGCGCGGLYRCDGNQCST